MISESRPEKLGNFCLVPLECSQKPSKKSQYSQMTVLKRLCAWDDSCSQLTTMRGPSWIFCPEEIMKTPNQYLSSVTWKNSSVKYLTVFFPNSWSAETEAHCVALARGAESSRERVGSHHGACAWPPLPSIWSTLLLFTLLSPTSHLQPGVCFGSSQRLWLHRSLLESLCFQASCRGPQISVCVILWMLNFMCQIYWATGYPVMGQMIFWVYFLKDDINIRTFLFLKKVQILIWLF